MLADLMTALTPAQLDKLFEAVALDVVPAKGGRGGKVFARPGGVPTCTEPDMS